MLNVDAVTAAILGLSVLLITGVVTWKECLAEAVAWDTLTWFAALIAMAGYLNKYGLISWFSQTVVKVCVSHYTGFSFRLVFPNYAIDGYICYLSEIRFLQKQNMNFKFTLCMLNLYNITTL